jgi:putative CocE/NonD family hydrolase
MSRHVRFFLWQSRKGLPAPLHDVRVERGIKIPMPDGTSQLADRYIPQTDEPCPTLLVRTPYGRGFPYDFMYGGMFAQQGFTVVLQSCRGTAGSTGEFEPFVSEAADAQATVAWLRGQDWFTGALATIGASYLGFTQWALAADPPPELKAMVIQVSSDDFRNFLYPGGAFAMEATLTGVSSMVAQHRGWRATTAALLRLLLTYRKVERSVPLIDGYAPAFGQRVPWFEEWLRRPAADDPYWEPRRARPAIAAAPPVSLLGGWSDVVLDDTLAGYQRLRAAGREARLIVGPWNHTSGFNKDMPTVFTEALGWLRAHVADAPVAPGAEPARAPVRVHVGATGGPGHWRDLADWPPPESVARQWRPRGDGALVPDPGSRAAPGPVAPGDADVASFRYDPARPTPSVGGPRMDSLGFGAQKNNALEARDDVLIYTGEPLAGPVDVIGPVGIRLRVRGSQPYFDIFARLCDVDANGTSWNVCDGLLRLDGSRDTGADGWTAIVVPMSSTAHRFGAGHRLRVQVSGGAHPRFARNTGTAEQVATATSMVPVDIEVDLGGALLTLPVTGS